MHKLRTARDFASPQRIIADQMVVRLHCFAVTKTLRSRAACGMVLRRRCVLMANTASGVALTTSLTRASRSTASWEGDEAR